MMVAACQFAPIFADARSNSTTISKTISELGASGMDLIVFPEAAVTGYCFGSADEARSAAVALDSHEMGTIRDACREAGVHAVVGYAESAGRDLYNSAAIFGPDGIVGNYRKTHIPCLGLDRFVKGGDELPVFDTPIGKIAVLICFDIRFPEAARTLSLRGAEIICVPTNWPESAELASDIMCPARTIENNIFIVACNRVGVENSFRFIGKSKIIAPGGRILAALENDSEGVISAEIDVSEARQKRIVKRPGEYEMELFAARRPELYG
jgi:predicted amidohydrolase